MECWSDKLIPLIAPKDILNLIYEKNALLIWNAVSAIYPC